LKEFSETEYLVNLKYIAQRLIELESFTHQKLHISPTLLQSSPEILVHAQRFLEASRVIH
jgi:hypothetical protein